MCCSIIGSHQIVQLNVYSSYEVRNNKLLKKIIIAGVIADKINMVSLKIKIEVRKYSERRQLDINISR